MNDQIEQVTGRFVVVVRLGGSANLQDIGVPSFTLGLGKHGIRVQLSSRRAAPHNHKSTIPSLSRQTRAAGFARPEEQ